eukprot:Lithocolla_globosa_v1_NODE_1323_length_2656_cov_23.532696.p2 type:complete len:158 gc:universal NODE_1323_length_2656_cov_23.532696:140-613(+)
MLEHKNIIEIVPKYKYLGIIIANDLSWKPMIAYIRDSSRRKLFALMTFSKRNNITSPKTLEFLYKCTILEYGAVIWGFAEIPELETIQLMMGRFILKVSQSTANVAVISELGWFMLITRRKELILRYLHLIKSIEAYPSTCPNSDSHKRSEPTAFLG